MDYRFQECLKKGNLVKIPLDQALAAKELSGGEYDLKRAKNSLSEGDSKWCIVQSYYSMFHTVKALIYSKGYREKSHKCLLIAFKALYVGESLLEERFYLTFEEAMNLREEADYGLTYSTEAAEEAVKNAGELLEKARELMESKSD